MGALAKSFDFNGEYLFAANDNIHTDKQNSVVALTNSSGAPISRRGYVTYGVRRDTGRSPGDFDPRRKNSAQMAETTHPFGYTGRRWESELGLYYYRARWYDPELGTFLQTDPIGSLDYINLYSYVGLNPMNATDPTGLKACPESNRNCVEDPDTEYDKGQCPAEGCPITPKQQQVDIVVVTAKRKRKIGNDRIDYSILYPEEQYGRIDGDRTTAVQGKQERQYKCSDGSSGASNVVNVSDFMGADAALHTHPDWANNGPGPDDGSIPGLLGIANYILSSGGVFVVEKTPVGFRARLVSGGWGDTSRSAVQATVEGYNRGNGSGNSEKVCTYR